MEEQPDNLKNLSQSARDWFVRILAAGSAGYGEFLKALSNYISAGEAAKTEHRFRRAQHALLWVTIAFISTFLATNWLLGPWDLRAAGLANDVLRAAMFAGSIYLARQKRVAVASQALLPLATICFLPFRQTPAPDWTGQPASFGAILVALFFIGWMLDYGASTGHRKWLPLRALSCVAGAVLFLVVLIVGWRFVTDGAWFPIFSLLAAGTAAPWYALKQLRRLPIPPIAQPESDEPFLYEAAWRRWRFFFTGRMLAVFLGAAPFLMFANQLDYQAALEKCLHIDETPNIVRMKLEHTDWWAYYWKDQGRFLTVEDLAGTPDPAEGHTDGTEPASAPAVAALPAPGVTWDEKPATVDDLHPNPEAQKTDAPEAAPGSDGVIRDIYLMEPSVARFVGDDIPARYHGEEYAVHFPDDVDEMAEEHTLTALTGQEMNLADFRKLEQHFRPWRVESVGRLVRRIDIPGSHDFYCLSYYPSEVDPSVGRLIGEKMDMSMMGQERIDSLIKLRASTKWLFFVMGILGCIFIWRRGGDSVVARWVGIWLLGASFMPMLDVAEYTLSRTAHWFWEQSILYHWNTVGAMLGPIFFLVYASAATAAVLWVLQLSPLMCWTHLCWPTRIHPQYSSIVRRLIVIGKAILVLFMVLFGFMLCAVIQGLLKLPPSDDWIMFMCFIMTCCVVMTGVGALLRIWTAGASELPKLSWIAVVAVLILNVSMVLFIPVVVVPAPDDAGISIPAMTYAGSICGWIFVALMLFLILRRDFLRVRAVSGFAALLLLLAVPFGLHWMEDSVTPMLGNSPFFRAEGAEMVTIMLVMFLFPVLHEWLHEQLLALSVPMLRRIEHHLEHSLEKIVDAETDHERVEMVSELLTEVGVKQYVLLSRRPGGRFAVDIDTLSHHAAADPHAPPTAAPAAPTEIEVSENLRDFLGKRRHFIDLTSIGFEWHFFFHQFELYRMTHGPAVGGGPPARFVLPICVGESLRGILLLGEGPLEAVISTPALSNNLNNLGLAAAMSRRMPRDAKH